jgi:hypothetical protein
MGDVVDLPVITSLDIPAERVLRKALDADLECAVVIGFDKDGNLYVSSSKADGGDVLWLLEGAKKMLLEIGFPADTD